MCSRARYSKTGGAGVKGVTRWRAPGPRQDLVTAADGILVAFAAPSSRNDLPTRPPRKEKHKRCAKCGKVVSTRALACVRCGKRQRLNPRSIVLGLAALAMVTMFAIAGLGSRVSLGLPGDSTWSRRSRGAAPAGHEVASSVTVTAADLWTAYTRDPGTADRRFRDKTISVTGSVATVPARDFRGDMILRLATSDSMETVRASVSQSGAQNVIDVVKGQVVTMACTGRGALIGSPILDGCALQ